MLITGCSEGGMGAALAIELHTRGLHVYATARSVSKMDSLTKLGIQTLPLDVSSESSIAECAAKIPSLDILVNNGLRALSIALQKLLQSLTVELNTLQLVPTTHRQSLTSPSPKPRRSSTSMSGVR